MGLPSFCRHNVMKYFTRRLTDVIKLHGSVVVVVVVVVMMSPSGNCLYGVDKNVPKR